MTRVEKAKLRKRIEDARKQAERDHAQAVKGHVVNVRKYAEELRAWRDNIVASLTDHTARVKGAKSNEEIEKLKTDYYGDFRITLPSKYRPDAPEDPGEFQPERYDTDLAFLDMVVEDEIKVDPKDRWMRYL